MPENNLSGEFILSKRDEPKPTSSVPKPEALTNPVSDPEPITTPEPTPSNPTQHTHEHNKPHFFSSFCYYPEGFRFKNQETDEEVVILVRQHHITNVPWILGVILLALVPPAVFILGPIFLPQLNILPALINIAVAFYYVCLFALALLYYTIWYFNVGIITNKRIIDLDVHNILTRVISEARLNSIQDVTATQTGGIRSIFNYGNIDIQTEARTQTIEFYRIPQPNFIRTVVGNLVVHRK